MASVPKADFLRDRHVKFFKRCLHVLPDRYASLDTSRMTIAFFAISGLDMLDALAVIESERLQIINWIYSLQVLPKNYENMWQCGFRGCRALGAPYDADQAAASPIIYDSGHIAMTYTALLSLVVLGDDLSKVNREAIMVGLKKLQLQDGSFCSTPEGSENDMRFVYCAACVCYILDDWSGLDKEKAVDFIIRSITYEGAFGQGPELEAHGGSTFCAVAALHLMGKLENALSSCQMRRLQRWCLNRQQSGFQGRPNKPVDTCYSFWVGATLEILGIYKFCGQTFNRSFLMDTQDAIVGGFAKWPGNSPDALHAYFGVCGLSLMREPCVEPMHASLNVSMRAANRLQQIQARWRGSPDAPDVIPHGLNTSEHTSLVNGSQVTDGCSSPDDSSESSLSNASTPREEIMVHAPPPSWQHQFLPEKHVRFFLHCLRSLPGGTPADSSRVTVAFFCLSSLDLLGALDLINKDKPEIIEWIYSLQVNSKAPDSSNCCGGFMGSPTAKVDHAGDKDCSPVADCSHLAMTYAALCSLVILGDDLSRVKREAIVNTLRHSQQENGSFSSSPGSCQWDMKFTYCAVCISYILNDFSGVDQESMVKYILQSQNYEGGFGQGPGLEAHGGATYCAVASLELTGKLSSALGEEKLQRLRRWCVDRQYGGFQSRTNKEANTSYSFWLGATLQMLGSSDMVEKSQNREFIMSCQGKKTGGFSPHPQAGPDALHGHYSLCALSLVGEPGISSIHVPLNISSRAAQHLSHIHGDTNHSANLS